MVQSSVDFSSFKFIRLNPEDSVKSFNCGDADLNDFILNHAREFQKFLLAVSYACVDSETGKIYAYCSLANDKVALTDFRDKTEFNRFRRNQGFPNEKRLKSYPAVKLCRLGVDVGAKGQRIGTTILNYVKWMFLYIDFRLQAADLGRVLASSFPSRASRRTSLSRGRQCRRAKSEPRGSGRP